MVRTIRYGARRNISLHGADYTNESRYCTDRNMAVEAEKLIYFPCSPRADHFMYLGSSCVFLSLFAFHCPLN